MWPKPLLDQGLPNVLFLRGGTMNSVAFSFGLCGRPVDILKRYRHKLQSDQPIKKQTARLQRVGNHFGFIFGCGSFVPFIEDYYRTGNPTPRRGLLLLSKLFVSVLFRGAYARRILEPVDAEIVKDHTTSLAGKHTLVTTSSVQHAGFHFTPYFYAQDTDHSLHLIVSQAAPLKLAKNVMNFFYGRPATNGAPTENLKFEHLKIDAKIPAPIFLDGEIVDVDYPLQITKGPLIQLLLP